MTKKTYQKPILTKLEKLEGITAAPVAAASSGPVNQTFLDPFA
ncbi:MAG: putative RiPP precursor [Hyphomicrobiales bacterium]